MNMHIDAREKNQCGFAANNIIIGSLRRGCLSAVIKEAEEIRSTTANRGDRQAMYLLCML